MRRFIALAILAFCGQAFADITMLLGPDGKAMPNGKYRLLVIPSDATQPPVNTVLDVGGTDGPVPPIVPPVIPADTLDARLTLLIAAVQDTDKAATAAKLKVGYEMTLQLTANTITDANSLRGVMAGIDKGILDSLKKTSEWQPWTSGLAALVAPLDFAQCLTTYKAAAAKLGGSTPNPTPPPTPPGPIAGTRAVILIESGDQTAEQATLLSQMRNDKAWSKLVTILDPDQQTDANQPDPLAQAAVKAAGNPLPRLQLINDAGSVVSDEPLPKTWDAAKAALTAKGVKP